MNVSSFRYFGQISFSIYILIESYSRCSMWQIFMNVYSTVYNYSLFEFNGLSTKASSMISTNLPESLKIKDPSSKNLGKISWKESWWNFLSLNIFPFNINEHYSLYKLYNYITNPLTVLFMIKESVTACI